MVNSFSKSNYMYSQKSYDQLVQQENEAIINNNYPLLLLTYLDLFKYYFNQRKYSQSLVVLSDCEKLLQQFQNDDLTIEFLRCKSMTVALNYELKETIALLPDIIRRAISYENDDLLALSYFLYSKCYAALGQLEVASKHALMGWYFARKLQNVEVESIIFNHYCLCLLERGEINKVASLYQKYQHLQQPLRSAVQLATIALEKGDEEQAYEYYESFFKHLESDDTIIFFDFQFEHILNRLSSYLKEHTFREKLASIYTRTLEARAQFTVEQFKAEQQYITTSHTNLYPLELLILNSERLIEQNTDGAIITNVFVRLQPISNSLEPAMHIDSLQIYMERFMKVNLIEHFIIGKIEDSSIYTMVIAESQQQAREILTQLEALILAQQPKYDGKLAYVHAFYERQSKTDFFEIYTNTVAKMFI